MEEQDTRAQEVGYKEEKEKDLLLTTIILVDGNMPSSAYKLFSVSFIISEQKQKQKRMR